MNVMIIGEKKMEFKKAYDEPIDYPSCPGEKIYTWTYINEDGVEVTESKNVFEEIQSFEKLTNYKELIENYGGIDNLPAGGPAGIYADVTGFGDSPDSAKQRIDSLIQEIRKALTEEQTKATKTTGEASSSDTTEISKSEGEDRK